MYMHACTCVYINQQRLHRVYLYCIGSMYAIIQNVYSNQKRTWSTCAITPLKQNWYMYTMYILCTRHFPDHSSERCVFHPIMSGTCPETLCPSLVLYHHSCHLTASTHTTTCTCMVMYWFKHVLYKHILQWQI